MYNTLYDLPLHRWQQMALSGRAPHTATLAAEASLVLTAFKGPTPVLRAFSDAVFDLLDANIEPRHTGYLERTKMAAVALIAMEVFPTTDTITVKDKWATKALYKACGYQYVKRPPHGDALTRAGFAACWAFNSSIWCDENYALASLYAARFNLKTHFVRQQFPHITPEARAAAETEWSNRFAAQRQRLGHMASAGNDIDFAGIAVQLAKIAVGAM
jgi:hypothetical protein